MRVPLGIGVPWPTQLVIGATGYVGFNVASAFRRAGHEDLRRVRFSKRCGGQEALAIDHAIGELEGAVEELNAVLVLLENGNGANGSRAKRLARS